MSNMLSNCDTKAGAEFSKQLLFKLLPDCFRFIIAGGGNEHILFKYIGNCVYSSIICNFISCNLSHLSDLLSNVNGENTILGFFMYCKLPIFCQIFKLYDAVPIPLPKVQSFNSSKSYVHF